MIFISVQKRGGVKCEHERVLLCTENRNGTAASQNDEHSTILEANDEGDERCRNAAFVG